MKCLLITGGSLVIGRAICSKIAASIYYDSKVFLPSHEAAYITAQVLSISCGLHS